MLQMMDAAEAMLADRTIAESVQARVNKGGKGSFTYIPWNETVKLLNKHFGVFGWDARVTHTANDFERGIYRTDIELTVRVRDEDGGVYSKTLPGTGVGIVVGANADAHDTAIKASRSDAISVAAKSLGDAFGLYLYDKGDPARNERSATSQQEVPTGASVKDGSGPRPSEKQLNVMVKSGYSAQQVAGMDFKDWKAVIDAIFAKTTPPIAPNEKAAPAPVKAAPKTVAPKAPTEDDEDELPF